MHFAVLGSVLVDGRSPPGAIERALLARLLVAPGTPVREAILYSRPDGTPLPDRRIRAKPG